MGKARRSLVRLAFRGVDISDTVNEDLISLRYAESEEGEADDMQIELHDRDGRWMNRWLDDALIAQLNTDIGKPKTKGMAITASIVCEHWARPGDSLKLDCGSFSLDSITADGPPHRVNIRALSLDDKSGIRTTKRSKSWENYRLSGVGREIASRARMGFIFDSGYDPTFERKEQNEQADIAFLKRLCMDSGASLKVSHGKVIIFDQDKYEKAKAVAVIEKGDGSYIDYSLRSSQTDTAYTRCLVRYLNPATGRLIQGEAKSEDWKEDGHNRTLVVSSVKVSSVTEANQLADKMLRMKNKFEKTGRLVMLGNPTLLASEVIELSGWGAFNGRYAIKQSVHDVGATGYTTSIDIRNVL